MIIIKANCHFKLEKQYIIGTILREFLGLDCEILFDRKSTNYEIILENKKRIIIRDHFFCKFLFKEKYLAEENIPKEILYHKNIFLVGKNIPIIYGNEELIVYEDRIICGIDVFASSFFMLTRWEEYVDRARDKHTRFPAYASLAFRKGFLDRPVVNEYVEMLWNMLLKLGIRQNRKTRQFKMIFTHDVDNIQRYGTALSGCKEILGDFVKRTDLNSGFNKIKSKFLTHYKFQKDPYDTFDDLMDFSESVGNRSYFFVMGKGTSEFDRNYINMSDKVREIIRKIEVRGHFLGLHGTYNSYKDAFQFSKEKKQIGLLSSSPITIGRQHCLRFEVPFTWQVWEDNNMFWDSTLGYPEQNGFRCGTCFSYNAFNILTRKRMRLREKPLIFMDSSYLYYQNCVSCEKIYEDMKKLIETCSKYKGNFVFLWHNSFLGNSSQKQKNMIFKKVINKLISH